MVVGVLSATLAGVLVGVLVAVLVCTVVVRAVVVVGVVGCATEVLAVYVRVGWACGGRKWWVCWHAHGLG